MSAKTFTIMSEAAAEDKIRPTTIKIDPDFFTSKKNEIEMYRGQMAKYKSDDTAKNVLLSTKDAKLQHFVRGSEPIIFYNSMKIRDVIAKNL